MNPLLAAVKGATKTAEEAAKSARKRMVDAVIPNPSMAYNLGMGIGPMLQAIVTEIKKKDGKKDGAAGASSTEKQIAFESKKQTKILSTQLSSMVSLLKDIKNIGLVQMRNEQVKAFESRKQQYTSKVQQILSGGSEQSPTEKKGVFSDMGPLAGMLSGTTLLKLLVGGGAAVALWNNVFDDTTKKTIRDFVFGGNTGGKSITEMVTEKIIEGWKASFDENPLMTIVGTGFAAWATGLLGVLGVAGRVAWGSGKLVYNIGAFVGSNIASKTPRSPVVPPVAGPQPAGTLPPAMPNATQKAGAQAQKLPGLQQGKEAGPTSKLPNVAATPAEEIAKRGSTWAKLGETLAKTGSVVSKALGVVGTGFSAKAAYDEANQGKAWSAGLYGASAAFGAGSLATGLSGVLAPAAVPLAGLSLLTGTLGAITSYFEKGSAKTTSDKPQPAATATATPPLEYKQQWSGSIDQQDAMKLIQAKFGAAGYNSAAIWGAISNAARESGLGQNMHTESPNEDSWGLFQMNRGKNGKKGMGTGYTPEQLLDPSFNTDLLINGLRQAEQGMWGDYWKNAATNFRNATSKEEAAEQLRMFLHGMANQQQKIAGQQRQAKVNQMVEAGKYGQMPDLVKNSSSLANAPSGYMPGSNRISLTNVEGPDARNASMLDEMTAAVNDLVKAMAGGMTVVDQSNKSTNVSSSTSVGGGPAIVNDTIKQKIIYEVIYR